MTNEICIYEAKMEYGVGGYHSHYHTFTGPLEKIQKQISDSIVEFEEQIMAHQTSDGDLRAYCPPNADGYPDCFFGPEIGVDFNVSISELKKTVTTTTTNDCDSGEWNSFTEVIGCT